MRFSHSSLLPFRQGLRLRREGYILLGQQMTATLPGGTVPEIEVEVDLCVFAM